MISSGEWIVDSGELFGARTSPKRKRVNRPVVNLCLRIAFAATSILSAQGCAQFQHLQTIIPNLVGEDVSKLRAERKQALVEEYERKRNTAIYQAALTRWDQGDERGCEESLKMLLGRAPDHREAHLLYSEVFLQRQDYAAAREHIEAVLAQNADDAEAVHAMGTLLDVTGEERQAAEYYSRAATLEPENEVYAVTYQQVTESRAGEGEQNSHKNDRAVVALLATAKTPEIERILRDATQAITDGQVDYARQAIRQATSFDPQNDKIPLQAALVAIGSHRESIAVAILTDATRVRSSAKLLRLLGFAHFRCGDFASSQAALEQSLATDANDPLAHYLLGTTLKQLGQRAAAEREFTLARQLDPTLQ